MVDHISGDEYYEAMESFGYDCTIEGRESVKQQGDTVWIRYTVNQ